MTAEKCATVGIRRPDDPIERPAVAATGRTGRGSTETGGTRRGGQAAEAARGGPATSGILWDGRRRSGSRPISRVLSRATIHLGRTSPCASSDLPGSPCGPQERARRLARFPIWSCSRWGLPCRRMLPPARCALTAPFHPYRPRLDSGALGPDFRPASATSPRRGLGGLLSVALSVGSRPPGVTWHLALWSPDFPPTGRTPPAILTRALARKVP